VKPTGWQRVAASALTGLAFVVVYNGCNYLASLRPHVGSCYFWWERYWPFVPILIIPYWSLDAFFMAAPLFIGTRVQLRQHVFRLLAAILIAGLFFLEFPLTLAWTHPPVGGFLGALFGSLNGLHNFYNCAPSLHIALRTCLWTIYVTPASGPLRFLLAGWFALIGVSTLLCWQHYLMDVITGQLLGLFCLHVFPADPPPRPSVDVRHRINADFRIARRYLTATLVAIALAILGWPATVFFLWPAVALAVLGVAYGGGGPAWLGKRDGILPHSTLALLAPYRWLAERTFRHHARRLPSAIEAVPGIWLGRRWSADWSGPDPLAVLDLTAEYPEHPPWRARSFRNIPVLDLTAPSVAQLEEACAFIADAPRPLLVHCSLGLGRSATVTAAWLVRDGLGVEEATAWIRERQPEARFAPGAEAVLRAFAACGK
jgi:membrane-associated phospholipid phosphatase